MNTPNILKCKFKDNWNKKPIVVMELDKLWASVPVAPLWNGRPFYNVVKEDIATNGMQFPILVVKSTYSNLVKQRQRHKKGMLDVPPNQEPNDIMYVVWGGSNRISIAKELGYTHIECVIYDGTYHEAFADQALQRTPYQKLYNRSLRSVQPAQRVRK